MYHSWVDSYFPHYLHQISNTILHFSFYRFYYCAKYHSLFHSANYQSLFIDKVLIFYKTMRLLSCISQLIDTDFHPQRLHAPSEEYHDSFNSIGTRSFYSTGGQCHLFFPPAPEQRQSTRPAHATSRVSGGADTTWLRWRPGVSTDRRRCAVHHRAGTTWVFKPTTYSTRIYLK